MTLQKAILLGFKQKAFHWYGRSSRKEFWTFFICAQIILLLSSALFFIPIIGSLIQSILVVYIFICQITAIIRRLHDTNRKGHIVALPYILGLVYFIALIPMYALQKDIAAYVMNSILALIILSYIYILYLCSKVGTIGPNRYGTDPLDHQVKQQDFINPDHLEIPEYLGDPWRKFKAKADRKKAEQDTLEQQQNNKASSSENNEQ